MTTIPKIRKENNRTMTKIIMKYGSTKVKIRKGNMEADSSHIDNRSEDEIFVLSTFDKMKIETSNFYQGLCLGLTAPSESKHYNYETNINQTKDFYAPKN